jgi:hypothetical protein
MYIWASTHLLRRGPFEPHRLPMEEMEYTTLPDKLEEHLLKRLTQAGERCCEDKIIIVYGKKCYVHVDEPLKRVDSILQAAGQGMVRVQGEYGYDMLASIEDRQRISGGRQDKILWFTPGWLKSWNTVYRKFFGWDQADANANFTRFYDKIIVLDSLGLAEEYVTQHTERVLELFDWTGLEIEFQPITLDRLKGLLRDSLTVKASV